ncbi:hypothetical protein CAAN3_21S01134 [[Candida] anglica]
MSFANNYWSVDSRTGIDKLSEQSLQSIQQLHELRKLVFSYMSYYYSNSEYLNRLGKDSHHVDKLEIPSATTASKSTLKRLSDQFKEATRLDLSPKHVKPQSNVNSSTPFKLHIENISQESHTLATLSSVIDNQVLEPITSFLKIQEPFVRDTVDQFSDLLEEYERCYKEIETIKKAFEENLRLQEMTQVSDREVEGNTIIEEESKEITPISRSTSSTINPVSSSNSTAHANGTSVVAPTSHFIFPMTIGIIKLPTREDLESLLKQMIAEISTVKRKIPIPGYRNETFSGEQLLEWLTHNRPHRISPTRANLERIGQAFIDLKLIVGMGFLGSKKFKSEGMWFEWTDLAIYASEEHNVSTEGVEEVQGKEQPEESTSTDIGTSSHITPPIFTLNNMISSVKTSILKTNFPQILEDLETKYNDMYVHLHYLRYTLDTELIKKSQQLEKFERQKIELIYKSLTKLSEIMYNYSLNSTNRLHLFATEMINNINKEEHYQEDFTKLVQQFSTGIYFPSILSPDNLAKSHYSSAQTNSNFQNVKLKFNLYKDFPLQPLHGGNEILSLASIPEFLYGMIEKIDQCNEEELTLAWKSSMNAEAYWSFKQEIISIISSFEQRDSDENIPANEESIHRDIISKILFYASSRPVAEQVNFVKYWLLEIGDSVIPFTSFDAVISNYTTYNSQNNNSLDVELRHDKLVSSLATIPRSNVSTLLYIIEHICKVFSLSVITSYGTSDNLEMNVNEVEERQNRIVEVSRGLNSMEAIGSIPFVHLLMRPSAVKNSTGFKPPLEKYILILSDLLNIKVRSKIFSNLVENELKYRNKREKEKKLPVKPELLIAKEAKLVIPKSPKPGQENFTLRPFRTRATPNPSPSTSPSHTPKNSLDVTRERSSSNTYLTPSINVEFE